MPLIFSIAIALVFPCLYGILAILPPSAHASTANGTFTLDKLLATETFSKAYISPDGKWVVWQRQKPIAEFKKNAVPILSPSMFAEVELYNIATGKINAVSFPNADSVALGPWSPDGKRLIIFGHDSRTGHTKIGVLNIATFNIEELPGTPSRPILYGQGSQTHHVLWIDSTSVIYAKAPSGSIPSTYAGPDHSDHMEKIFQIYKNNDPLMPQLITHDSGLAGAIQDEENVELIRVNIVQGDVSVLIKGIIHGISVSPDRSKVVALRRNNRQYAISGQIALAAGDYSVFTRDDLFLIKLSTTRSVDIPKKIGTTYFKLPVVWSSDSTKISYYEISDGETWQTAVPFIYNISYNSSERLIGAGLNLTGDWSAAITQAAAAPIFFLEGRAYVVAEASTATELAGSAEQEGQKIIWALSSITRPQRVNFLSDPVTGYCIEEKFVFFTSRRQAILTNTLGNMAETRRLHYSRTPITSPVCRTSGGRPYAQGGNKLALLLNPPEGEANKVIRVIDYINGKVAVSYHLPKEARLIDYSSTTGDLLIEQADASGDRLVLIHANTKTEKVLKHVNRWLISTKLPHFHKFEYEIPGIKGKLFTAWYLAPPGFSRNRHYPTVVRIYPGLVFSYSQPPFNIHTRTDYYHAAVAASDGYITLFASVPIDDRQYPLNLPQQITAATIAATDAAIQCGIADPRRLILSGHSAGAYAVAAVLSRTQRFAAGIATSGVYNLTSLYGTFDPLTRTEASSHLRPSNAGLLEGDFFFLRAPPWKDPETYVRNSPLFSAHRISTPLLLIHGDLDYAPVTQAEELFSAMVREGQRARFVRLWGEGHTPERPQQIAASWNEIKRWLFEYAPPTLYDRSGLDKPGANPSQNTLPCNSASRTTAQPPFHSG